MELICAECGFTQTIKDTSFNSYYKEDYAISECILCPLTNAELPEKRLWAILTNGNILWNGISESRITKSSSLSKRRERFSGLDDYWLMESLK